MQKYYYLWRNKFLAVDASSTEEFVAVMQAAAERLQRWKQHGVVLEHGADDDYATFSTTDAAFAAQEGFQVEDDEEGFDC